MNYSSSPPSPASTTLHHHKLLHELTKGQKATETLLRRQITPSLPGPDDSVSDSALVELILKSFDISLSTLKNLDPSSSIDDCKIEESCGGGGDIGDETASRVKDRRGCYKRRKRGQSWTMEGEAPTEDGHQWRKYGQKMILHSTFPRNYYRCTHKMDQGCQAMKQVQKTSDEPPNYKTTYSGDHTCKNPHKNPQLIIPSTPVDQSNNNTNSFLLSFDTSSSNKNNVNPFFQPPHKHSDTMSMKQEQQLNEAMMMSMMMSSEYDNGGDVISIDAEYSCSTSPLSLEIDGYMMLGQDHLDHLIQFECESDIQ